MSFQAEELLFDILYYGKEKDTNQKIVDTVEHAAKNAARLYGWNDSRYGIECLFVGPCSVIEEGVLKGGFLMHISSDAVSFPPPGISSDSINRGVDMFVVKSRDKSGKVEEVAKFPTGHNGLMDAISQETLIDLIDSDHNNSAYICMMSTEDSNGMDKETCCIIVDTDGCNNLSERIEGDDIINDNLVESLQRGTSEAAMRRKAVADAIVNKIWDQDDHGQALPTTLNTARGSSTLGDGRTYFASIAISNSYGGFKKASSYAHYNLPMPSGIHSIRPVSTPYVLYVGMSDASSNHHGTLIKEDLPGSTWTLYKGYADTSSSFMWTNDISNAVPHSYGYIRDIENTDDLPLNTSEMKYVPIKLANSSKLCMTAGGTVRLFENTMFNSRLSREIDDSLESLGFDNNWSKILISVKAQLVITPSADDLPLQLAKKSLGVDTNIRLNGKLFRDLCNASLYDDNITPEIRDVLKSVFPTLVTKLNRNELRIPSVLLDFIDEQNGRQNVKGDSEDEQNANGLSSFL